MSVRIYDVRLGGDGGERTVRVAAEIDVQAGDAAASLMKPDEAILSIAEVRDADRPRVEAGPPLSQAAEFSDVTEGEAASDAGRSPFS
nr:hypothetical protein [uncultured Brevundimonas sp.]